MNKVLIIGKTPPPIGGVTVHVSRLLAALSARNFKHFDFYNIADETLANFCRKAFQCEVIHLHISNPFLQCTAALFCRLLGKKLLITYHGNWGRYRWTDNLFVCLSAWLAEIPIVQNAGSLAKARKWNRNAVLISTYLPDFSPVCSDENLQKQLSTIAEHYEHLFCTNAWNVTFHKTGQEVYGISALVKRMKAFPRCALIVSDPSGRYLPYLRNQFGIIPHNVFLISHPHDFRQVLKMSDALIRNTATDGVSLSIHEAFKLNVPVFASSVVKRQPGCYVFSDVENTNFPGKLANARKKLEEAAKNPAEDPVSEIMRLYEACLAQKPV